MYNGLLISTNLIILHFLPNSFKAELVCLFGLLRFCGLHALCMQAFFCVLRL